MNSYRLLIIEDDGDTAEAMSRLLDRLGHYTHKAGSVAAALAAVEAETFDLLIVDLLLPDGDGYELLARLEPPRPRAICVSACASDEDHERCLRAGFAAHLAKPLSFDVLTKTIDSLLTPRAVLQAPAPFSVNRSI